MKHLKTNLLMMAASAMMLLSCSKAESLYANISARFHYAPVASVPTLYRACTSLGEFCKVTEPIGSGGKLVVQSATTTDYIPRTQIEQYTPPLLGLGGIIIGLPTVPEMLQNQSNVVCFDLCCSNCDKDFGITKQMELQSGGYAYCAYCQRTYDLNSYGIVSKGKGGRALYRYYCYYNAAAQQINVNN